MELGKTADFMARDENSEGEEMARLIKYLPCKREDLSSDPQHSNEKLGTAASTYDSSTEGGVGRNSCGTWDSIAGQVL